MGILYWTNSIYYRIIYSRFYHPISSEEQTYPIFCEKHFGAVVSTSVKLGNHWLVFTYTLARNDSLMACHWLRAPLRRQRSCCKCEWQRVWRHCFPAEGEAPATQLRAAAKKASPRAGAASRPNNLVFSAVFWEHEYVNKCGKCELLRLFFVVIVFCFFNYGASLISN